METAPTHRKLPAFGSFLPFSILLALVGWLGVIYLIITTLPTLGPRWLFFFFITIAMTGTGLPVIVFLNLRFPSYPPIDTPVVIRQACWIGVYAGILTWLQLGRILTPTVGVIISVGLVLIEGLIRFREKSQWSPSNKEQASESDSSTNINPPQNDNE